MYLVTVVQTITISRAETGLENAALGWCWWGFCSIAEFQNNSPFEAKGDSIS